MASLQELRKRLRTIKATGQMAGAMRTAATAKYARVSRERDNFSPFAEACSRILSDMGGVGIPRNTTEIRHRDALIIISSNRGMCGGFNSDFFRFVNGYLDSPREEAPILFVCGKKACAMFREREWNVEEFPVSDVPSFEEILPVCRKAREMYVDGQVERVIVLYQSYKNMMTQIPTERQILPETNDSRNIAESDLLFLPDRETIGDRMATFCYESSVFHLFLDNAAGAQAATLLAMRSACDNAEESAAKLELLINRRRQAEVTARVIETASGNLQQGD